jgi:hypothetical protein
VENMPEERTVKKVLKNILEGKGSVRKPRKRWLDDVEYVLRKWLLERGEK